MRRSFQGLTNNVGRSMHNFMSAISSGMKSMQAGLFNRSPKHISFQPPSSSNHYQEPTYNLPSFVQPDTFPIVQEPGHAVQHVHQGVYNPDCDCTDETPFVPVDNSLDGYKETETAPAYAVLAVEEYGSPQATVITDEYGSPQSSVISGYVPVSPEPVYQPSSQYNPVPQNGQFAPAPVVEPVQPVQPVQPSGEYGQVQPQYTLPQPVDQYSPVQTVETVQSEYVPPPSDEYGLPASDPIVEYTPVQTAESVQPEYTIVQEVQSSDEYGQPLSEPVLEYTPVETVQQFGPTGVQPTPAPAPFTTTPGGEVYTTTLYEVPSHLSDEEICAHLKQLKEDIHRSPINHAGGSNDIDIHKLETVGVHSEHKKSSAVVPDQLHPEKYISIDCANVKRVVNQRIYYKDTKPLKANLHGKNRVRETLVI